MFTISFSQQLESEIIAAARRAGMPLDEYLAIVCADALSLEIDRARLDSYLAGTPGVLHEKAQGWLADLAAGNRTECPR
ncbi:MAG: hypothetical protein WBP86_04620 [Thiobacillaceae bacterium]